MTHPHQSSTSIIDEAPFTGFQIGIAALCAIVAMLDGFDTQSIAYVAPRIAQDWGMPIASFGPIFGAGLLGLTIGAFVLTPAADRFGRKAIILVSVLFLGLFALLTAPAADMTQLLIFRLLTGIGLGGAMPNIIALTNEYALTRYKATLVTVMFCGFPLGSTIGGCVTAPLLQVYGWHSVCVIGGVLPLVSHKVRLARRPIPSLLPFRWLRRGPGPIFPVLTLRKAKAMGRQRAVPVTHQAGRRIGRA